MEAVGGSGLGSEALRLSGEETMDPERKTKLKAKAVHELREYLFVSLYLWIFLAMFVQSKSLVLAEHHIDFTAHGVALINALVLGKFLLIARAFHPGKRAEDAPLIYPTLLKAAILAIMVAILKVLEDMIVGHFRGKSLAESIADIGGGSGKAMLVMTLMLFVVLIPLTAFGELQRVIGEEKLQALFLRPRDPSKPFGQPAV
jgi:hypothetical protein